MSDLLERYARAVVLLQAIAAEAELLNAALAADEITQKQARVRVQNIHGLAATPEVEEWEVVTLAGPPHPDAPDYAAGEVGDYDGSRGSISQPKGES